MVVANFTPVPRDGFAVPAPAPGPWTVLANSDDERYGGSGYEPGDGLSARDDGSGGSVLAMNLAPLAVVVWGRSR